MNKQDKLANLIKERVAEHTGIKSKELVCPREQSPMTPCVCRDGHIVLSEDGVCIGCGFTPEEIIEEHEEILGDLRKETKS